MHLGIDLGTSSVKLLAAHADGQIAGGYEQPLDVVAPQPGWAEADPAEWWTAIEKGMGELGDRWDGVAVTGQMHGTVLVDSRGDPLRPAVLWPDTRAADRATTWAALPADLAGRLGGPFSPGMTGPVLAWLAEHEPEVVAAAERVLLPKDFVRGRLTGDWDRTDRSDASGTLLWDVAAERWSAAFLDVPDTLLPEVVASGEVAGGGDTATSLLAVERAVGGWRPGDRVVNVGSGAQVIDPVVAAPTGSGAPGWHTYADCGTGHYAMVAVINAGIAVAWARQRLAMTWDEYSAACAAAPAGAGGCVFVPALASERGVMRAPATEPHWVGADDPALRARAVAEAQAFLIRRADELLAAPPDGRVFVVGGGARESWICELLAAVLGRDVTRLEVRSAAALGALCLSAGPDFAIDAPAVTYAAEPSAALDDAYARWLSPAYDR